MFFMMGITQQRKDLIYNKVIVCDECHSYGRYAVFMTYTVLSLFFIPVFKWNKQYYVETSCCHTVYQLDPEIGRQIEYGQNCTIESHHLHKVHQTFSHRCSNCGYVTYENFQYCPKCGHPF